MLREDELLALVGAWAPHTMHPRTASPKGLDVQFPPCIAANLAAPPSRMSKDFPASRLPARCSLFPLQLPGLSLRRSPKCLPSAQVTDGEILSIASSDLAKILCLKKASTTFIYSSDNISVATQVWSSPSPKSPSCGITSC